MKPQVGQKLENGAIVTAVHKQYPATSCPLYLIAAYWDSEPYTPYLVWEYNADHHGHAFGGSYCDSVEKQTEVFNHRKLCLGEGEDALLDLMNAMERGYGEKEALLDLINAMERGYGEKETA
tara:strand:- start:460 stop:825 length:366 start_codon:yes stop_codon:yes gene_type:complete